MKSLKCVNVYCATQSVSVYIDRKVRQKQQHRFHVINYTHLETRVQCTSGLSANINIQPEQKLIKYVEKSDKKPIKEIASKKDKQNQRQQRNQLACFNTYLLSLARECDAHNGLPEIKFLYAKNNGLRRSLHRSSTVLVIINYNISVLRRRY